MNDPEAPPTQFTENKMAFVVTFFVCPAVVCDTQLNANTVPETTVPDYKG